MEPLKLTEQQLRDKLENELLPLVRDKGQETKFTNMTWPEYHVSRIKKRMTEGWNETIAGTEYLGLKRGIESLEDQLPRS